MPKPLSPGSREKTWKLVLHKAASTSTEPADSATTPSFRWVTRENKPLKENKYQEVIQSSQETTKWIKEAFYTRAPFFSPWQSFLTIHGERENCAQHHTLYSLAVSPVKSFRIPPLANSLKPWSTKSSKFRNCIWKPWSCCNYYYCNNTLLILSSQSLLPFSDGQRPVPGAFLVPSAPWRPEKS